MIFADMFSPSDTRFSPSCDPPDGTFSPNLSDLRDEGQLNENRLARVPAINSLALLREAAAGLVQPPDGMAEDEWIDFVRHYESEYISDLPVADVIS